MVEYIEREAACMEAGYIHGFGDDKYVSLKDIESIPAADVASVVHGRWVLIERTIGMKTYRCSECKDDDFWNTRFCFGYENYCLNCGAKMDGE